MFKITQGHMTLWLLKRGPKFIQDKLNVPKSDALWKPQPFDINSIIPEVDHKRVEYRKRSRAGKSLMYPSKEKRCDYHNAIVLLRSKMKRGQDLVEALGELAEAKSPIQPHRGNIARKWLRRVVTNRMKSIYDQMPELKKFVETGEIS